MGYKVPADGQTPKDLTRFLAHLVLEFDIIYIMRSYGWCGDGAGTTPPRISGSFATALQRNGPSAAALKSFAIFTAEPDAIAWVRSAAPDRQPREPGCRTTTLVFRSTKWLLEDLDQELSVVKLATGPSSTFVNTATAAGNYASWPTWATATSVASPTANACRNTRGQSDSILFLTPPFPGCPCGGWISHRRHSGRSFHHV